MIVMPANSSGWFWHALARETGRLGHLYSPGAQRGPWPWFPFALDNGAFSCWEPKANIFDESKWRAMEWEWHRLIVWAQCAPVKPRWAIVPDVPGDAESTLRKWQQFAPALPFTRALAVQNGMTPESVASLKPPPDVIAVGGSTDWKWASVASWAKAFPRVHLLRCNAPTKLYELEALGVESCDGTGWNRGDRKQTERLEQWARSKAAPVSFPLWPHVCRQPRVPDQGTFA